MSKDRRVTEGGRRLRQYLTDTDQSVPQFAERNGICRIQIQRVLNGDRTRISVDFAKSIFEATGGVVPIEAWSSETLQPVDGTGHTASDFGQGGR